MQYLLRYVDGICCLWKGSTATGVFGIHLPTDGAARNVPFWFCVLTSPAVSEQPRGQDLPALRSQLQLRKKERKEERTETMGAL